MRFFVVPKKQLLAFVCAMIIFLLIICNISNESMAQVYFNQSFRKVPIYSVQTDKKQVAISFDAAWGADKTKDIINILKQNDCGATFFLVGFWVDKYPELVKEIDGSGLEIGSHSNTHPDLTKLSQSQIKIELETVNQKVKDITSKDIKVFRSPYGAYNNMSIDVAERLGLTTIQWDVDSLDWKGISASKICSNILTKVKNGSIILCHNNSDHIVEALPTILTTLKERGYKVTSVSDLIYKDNYSINTQGIQIKNGD